MGIPWFFLIVLILVAIFMAVSEKGEKCKQPRRRRMLALGLALLVGMVALVLVFFLASHERFPSVSSLEDPALAVLSHESDAAEPVVTNEELWNRLTESRINLDEEPEIEPPAEPEPKMRPDWVDNPPKRVGDLYRAVVASDPFSTVDECFEQLEHRFPGEVQERLTKLVPSDQRSLIGSETLDAMGVTLDYIMREICREQFTETVDRDYGEMNQVYVLMEFTPAIESHLLDAWQNHLRRYRLTTVAQISGGVLATLAILYGLLQLDTWTRGYYTRRLLWGVPAAIIAIAVVVLFVS